MKITFGILTLCKGGAQRMLAELANGLVRRGHDVNIVMPDYGVIEYPLMANVIRTNNQLINGVDYPPSDVIISNYYTTVTGAAEASVQGKGKHVRLSLCYEPIFLPENEHSFITYNATEKLVVLSKWQKDIIQLNHGIIGKIVPVGISSEFVNLHQRSAQKPIMVSAIVRRIEDGNWHRQQDYLLEVLTNIKMKYPHIIATLITPPNEFRTSQKLKQLYSEQLFQFVLPQNDQQLNAIYNQTDIFVNSSIYDTASLPGLEAMKTGAALVTTYNGGNADYARHEENCLLSYRYQNRLQQDIERLIENPELRKRLAAEGEKEASSWTWERSVDLFEQAIL
ncbi:glycosyltransferase family 4 protein [Scopulibacillus cellulosilyticus]|uniref:Glycosyltransferase family 4 protein n=1 Tax=Scopulibacillus cellulosilyticus TaxID=2665665 RepID=A0ABW2Q3Z8_9BACL